jgi:hypothetical protein
MKWIEELSVCENESDNPRLTLPVKLEVEFSGGFQHPGSQLRRYAITARRYPRNRGHAHTGELRNVFNSCFFLVRLSDHALPVPKTGKSYFQPVISPILGPPEIQPYARVRKISTIFSDFPKTHTAFLKIRC